MGNDNNGQIGAAKKSTRIIDYDFCHNRVGFPFSFEGRDMFAMLRNNNNRVQEVYISGQTDGLDKDQICGAIEHELRATYKLPDEEIKTWIDRVDLNARHPDEFLNFAGSYEPLERILRLREKFQKHHLKP